MSGQATTYFRQEVLKAAFHRVPLPFTSFQVALTRRAPTSNAAVNQLDEPGPFGYTRVSYPLGSSSWFLGNNVEMSNTNTILFPRASGPGWGTIHGWALIAVGPSMVCAVGTLVEPLRAVGGIQPRLSPGAVVFGQHD